MYNQVLNHLTDYPFDRLRLLLEKLDPPNNQKPIVMSLGEPQHNPPPFVAEIIARHSNDWGKYPPVNGTPDLLNSIVDWLGNRYDLPDGVAEPATSVIAVNGTKEALFMAGDLCVPRNKSGNRPIVLMPNPFYQVYLGAAVIRDAEIVYFAMTSRSSLRRAPRVMRVVCRGAEQVGPQPLV